MSFYTADGCNQNAPTNYGLTTKGTPKIFHCVVMDIHSSQRW